MSETPSSEPDGAASQLLIEALSREEGKNSTVRVYPDRIEWLKEQTISSLPRPDDDPPVIPLSTVRGTVKAKKDGPLFSKVVLRTEARTITFRMYPPVALQLRDILNALLAGQAVAPVGSTAPAPPKDWEPASEDLQQLQALVADGMLSPEEFEAAKAQLRSR
jgi:hypothetical protein